MAARLERYAGRMLALALIAASLCALPFMLIATKWDRRVKQRPLDGG